MSLFGPTYNKDDWFEKIRPTPVVQHTFFPRSIGLEDIDRAVVGWFNDTEVVIDDRKLPVLFLTPEKWAELKQNWNYTDGNTNVQFPYVTIRRPHNPRPIDNPTRGRIPNRKYTTYRVPYVDNGVPTIKEYKVPQPVRVMLTYEFRVLAHYTTDINIINQTLLRHFASLHSYLDIDKQHYMPMRISSVSDESDFDDLEKERVIHTLYSVEVEGYLIDEVEFEEKIGMKNMTISVTEEI